MREDRMRQSSNVEDRRGARVGGLGGGRMVVGGGLGTLVLVIIVVLLGGNPLQLLQQTGGTQVGQGVPQPIDPAQQQTAEFVSRVLGDTEDVWTELFRQQGAQYEPPTLVLFSGEVESACGFASAATGPFYCPADHNLYIDLGFFDDLDSRYGAPGDFAQAYVIAHEVGHHVQTLLGTTAKVRGLEQRVATAEANGLSVRFELQADFYAGVWAHFAQKERQVLEAGDIDEGLAAAAAVGDDRLQRQARGRVVPESFTHGTSEQRARWFRKGFESGDISKGDTFSADPL